MYKIFSVLLVGMFFLATSVAAEARTVIYDQNTGRKLCEGTRECRQYERTAPKGGGICEKNEFRSLTLHRCLAPTDTKFLYEDQVTGFMEVDLVKCGRPGFWATLVQGVVKALIQGYSVDALGYQGGYAVSGVASGFVDIVAQNRLGKKCNIPSQLADINNFTDEVQMELFRENWKRQQHLTKLSQMVVAQETGQPAPVAQAGMQPQQMLAVANQPVFTSTESGVSGRRQIFEACVTDIHRLYPELVGGMDFSQTIRMVDGQCQAAGKGRFGIVPGTQTCRCGAEGST